MTRGFRDPPVTYQATLNTQEDYMANLNIHASPEFLNELDWQLRRLSLLIESLEHLAISTRDLQTVLSVLLREARINR